MKNNFHILTGDALKEQFPKSIIGKQIIMREILVEGPIINALNKDSLSTFYKNRNTFLTKNYEIGNTVYDSTSKSEIEKIRQLSDAAIVYLWFEDDLFCQINMWFVCFLLAEKTELQIKLIRPPLAYSNNKLPETILQYGFGGLNTSLLETAFENATEISRESLQSFAQLWKAFAQKNETDLSLYSSNLESKFDFISDAKNACINLWNDHPRQLLKEIQSDLHTNNFGEIFKAFNKQGAIYGFGDSQVKRIWNQIEKDNSTQ